MAPYDDPLTVAGQGTIGTEILRQVRRISNSAQLQHQSPRPDADRVTQSTQTVPFKRGLKWGLTGCRLNQVIASHPKIVRQPGCSLHPVLAGRALLTTSQGVRARVNPGVEAFQLRARS